MSRKRPAKESAARGLSPAVAAWLAPLAAALLAVWVHRGSLAVFYTTDDLILFERANGIAPYPATLWRVIPGRLWIEALLPSFGMAPFAWHAASLALHAAVTALVAVWARRLGLGAFAAFTAAAVFGANARLRTAVWPVSGTGELLAALLVLLALIALERRSRPGDAFAAVAHGVAMLCKEVVALAPLVAWLVPPVGERRRLPIVPLALGLAMWAYVLANRGSTGSLGGEAYAVGLGRHVLDHLLVYTIWSCDVLHVTGCVGLPLSPALAALGATLFAACAGLAWRSGGRAARAGLWLWLLALLPVLPLVNAVYDHYLYVPEIGGSVLLAALLDRFARGAAAPAGRAKLALGLSAALVLARVATGEMFLAAAEGARIAEVNLPRDSFQRRLELVRNATISLERQLPADERRIVIYDTSNARFRVSARSGALADDAATAAVKQRLFDAVFDEGRGLRALFPRLQSVRLGTSVEPGDAGALVFVSLADGRLVSCGRGANAHLGVARIWVQSGMPADARRHLEQADALHPGILARSNEAGLVP